MTLFGSVEELSTRQQALLDLMLTGKTVEHAAKECHVAERTAYRWAKLPAFKKALSAGQQALFEEHLGYLRMGIRTALTTLARNMGEIVPPSVQVRAAQVWLEQAVTLYKVDEETAAVASVVSREEWQRIQETIAAALLDHPAARVAVAAALARMD